MADPVATGKPSSALRRVLIPLALAQFICSFAGSNMNVMITDMSEDLDTTVQGIQTAITIFLLVMAALMIPAGKLTDRYGRKRLFLLGLIVYGIGAVMSAVSPGLGVLILGNSILEGVGTALLIPPVYILTTLLFTEVTSRARAFGAIMAMGGVGAAAGPLIGGLIATALSWRWAFVFQALIIVVIVLLSRHIEDPLPPEPGRPFDTLGAVLSAVGLVLLVMGILAADDNGWLMLGLLAAGALVLVWFFLHVRAEERAGKEPLLSTSLFRNKTSNLGLVTQNAQWLVLMGVSFVVAAYLQVVRGYNAIETGVIFTAATLGVLLTSFGAERFAKRREQRTLIMAGFVLTIVGIGRVPRHGEQFAERLGVHARSLPHRPGCRLDAHSLGQRRAVGLRRGAAGGDLGPVPQRLQPRVLPRHRDRRHHPGRRPHDPRLWARDGRPGRDRRSGAGGRRVPPPDPRAGAPGPARRPDTPGGRSTQEADR